MQSKLRFMLLLSLIIGLLACTKDDDPPVQPPTPEPIDSLGAGWQRIQPTGAIQLEDIFFVNSQVGFVCGEKYLGKSVDGGLTWNQAVPDSLKQHFINIFFIDQNTGWVNGDNFILRTMDGGNTWKKMYRGLTFDMQFFDANNGFVSAFEEGMFKTTDGGLTLQRLNTSHPKGLFFLDQNTGWYSDDQLFKTEDGGTAFTKTSNTNVFGNYAIQFTDELHGWLAGYGLRRTIDGGVTFETIFKDGFCDIQFFDKMNGFILSGNSIYSTVDGGKTLVRVCAANKGGLFEIHFTDPDHGWATGTGGTGGNVYRYVKP